MNTSDIPRTMEKISARFILLGMSGVKRGWFFCNLASSDLTQPLTRGETYYWGSGEGPDIENAFLDAVRKFEADKVRDRSVYRSITSSSVPTLNLNLGDL